MDFPDFMGSIGVTILLTAFVLNLLKVIKADGNVYSSMNFIGAGMACYASWLIHYIPFVILEGAWALVSLTALIRETGK